MLKETTVTIRGLSPLLMHNGNLADPLHESSIALHKLTVKKLKTQEFHKEVSRCEWFGGLYVDQSGHPCLPGEVLEGALCEGARQTKRGKLVKGAIVVNGDFKITYKGPKTLDALFAAKGFVKRAGVKIGKARIMRTRPIFPEWGCTFTIQWDADMLSSEGDLNDIISDTGRATGIGDWRPKFGRFELV